MHKPFSFRIPKGWTYFLWCLSLVLAFSPQATAQLPNTLIQEETKPLAVAEKERLNHIKFLLEQKETDEALAMLEDTFESGTPFYRADEFTFLHAQAFREEGETSQAIIILEHLLKEYPFSPLTNQARLLLSLIHI